MSKKRMVRRDFLRTSAAVAAGISLPYLIPSRVLGGPDQPGANDIIKVGLIGCGGRGTYIATNWPKRPAKRKTGRLTGTSAK